MKDRNIACVLILVLVCISFANCKINEPGMKFEYNTTKNKYKDEYNVKKVKLSMSNAPILIDSIGSINSIVVLDTSAIIGQIDKIQVSENNIYIMDVSKSKSVFCFSRSGRFKWKFANVESDNGVRKFKRLGDMQVKGANIYLLDDIGMKILTLDTNGHCIRKTALPMYQYFYPDKIFVDTNNNFIIYNEDYGNYEKFPFAMTVTDSSCKKVLSCNMPQSDNPPVGRWKTAMTPLQEFKNGNGFYYTKPLNDTIYAYSNGVFSRRYAVDFGKNSVPEQVKFDNDFTFDKFLDSHYYSNIERIIENDSLVSFLFGNGANPSYAFIDKETLDCKAYPNLFFNIDGFFQQFLSIGGYDGKLITQINPINIISIYDRLSQNGKIKNENTRLYNLRKKLSINSNPILVFITISRQKIFYYEKN